MSPSEPADMMDGLAASMKERTGKDLDEWVALVKASGLDPHDQLAVRRWLRERHGVLLNTQWAIADAAARAAGWVRPTPAEYTDTQYQGKKAALRPIYDRLEQVLTALGADVRTEGRSTYVPFVRGRQFAAVQAATATRIDVGLRFTDPPVSGRLKPAKAPGQATHKVTVTSLDDVDDDLIALLRTAYDQNP